MMNSAPFKKDDDKKNKSNVQASDNLNALSALFQNQFQSLKKNIEQNEKDFWKVSEKKDYDKQNKGTFGKEIRKDLFSDQNGNIIQRNTTFGCFYNKSKTAYKSEKQKQLIEDIKGMKARYNQSQTRKFQLNDSYANFCQRKTLDSYGTLDYVMEEKKTMLKKRSDITKFRQRPAS